jgi:hypothetical protein
MAKKIDHLNRSLILDRFKKLGKISEKLLLS